MRLPPPEVIASWPTPNYDDPVRRGPAMLIIQLTILPIAFLTLVFRLYVRIFIVRLCQLDDWLMCAAMLFSIGVTICVILACQIYGWDVHVWDLKSDVLTQGRQASIAAQTMFIIAAGLVKTSILVSYLRIAPLNSRFRLLTQWTIGLVIPQTLIFLIVLWAQCTPAKDYWNLLTEHHCIDEGPPLMAHSISNVLTDFIVYVLPLPILIGVRLPTLQRVALLGVFSLGFLVVVAGCIRAYWVYEVVLQTYDVTWQGYTLWIWVAVEVNFSVICGCVPTLRPLFQSSRRKNSSSGSGVGATSSRSRAQQSSQHCTDVTRSRNSGHGVESIEATFHRLGHVLGRKLRRPKSRSESLHSGNGDLELIVGKTPVLEANVTAVPRSPGPWLDSDSNIG